MIKLTYNKKENIIYLERNGEIKLQDLLNNIKDIDQKFHHLKSLYIIEDTRKSTVDFKAKDYPTIIDYIKRRINKYNKVRSAIIVNNLFDTVLSLLYEEMSKEIENYEFKTFYTKEAAKTWLMQ